MAAPQITGPQSQGLSAQGLQPAGMLRISKGQQERYVWPVHLPGWLAVGWRVVGAAADRSAAGATTAPPPVPPAEPAPTRGKRGRRRKQESSSIAAAPEPVAVIEPDTELASVAEQQLEQELALDEIEPLADAGTNPDHDPAGDRDTAAEVPVLTALPDDLFDDPLI